MPKPSTKSSAKKTKSYNKPWLAEKSKIKNASGLHARATALFVTLAKQFLANVEIGKEGQYVNGKSILAVLMLGALQGETITIRTKGPQAKEALEQLKKLVELGFNEL